MDVTQNASASQAADQELRLPSVVSAETPTDSESVVTATATETATPPKPSTNGQSAALDDLTSPPPAYIGGKYRQRFYQVWRPKNPPSDPPSSLDDAATIPLAKASVLSELLYIWINPIMRLGYQRPLQATDLWRLDEPRTASVVADRLQRSYDRRQQQASAYNARLDADEIRPNTMRRFVWHFRRKSPYELHAAWKKQKRRKASLTWCLSELGGRYFWVGGLSKIVGDMSQLMGPIVSRQIIEYAQGRAAAKASNQPIPYIGNAIGAAFGLFLLTCSASIFTHFFFYRAMASGVLMRAALSTCMYRKSLTISNEARVELNNGKLMAHLSTDISRIDYAAQWIHAVWTAPIQIAVCAILLIVQIGPSALVGLALFAMLVPLQSVIMGWQIKVRAKSMLWTDARSRTLQELLSSFSIIKYFVFEKAYLARISQIRGSELKGVRSISLIKAFNQSLALSLPTLAAVVSFICYAGIGNYINPAKIFTALSLFSLLRQPLMFLPRALSAAADASNAIKRLEVVFEADTRTEAKIIDTSLEYAIDVQNATFRWLSTEAESIQQAASKQKKRDNRSKAKKEVAAESDRIENRHPFQVNQLSMQIKHGQLVAIVGAVGAGKSSILSGLIGEMLHLGGTVTFGGKIAYCSQSAFIQNATLRDNILFGQPWNEAKYWQVLKDASLIADCLQLPDGDLTEIGERGINISGGQKQRVNVARALYYDADIVLFDDPLSALDAHIGQALFDNAMRSLLIGNGKTVVLVTNALHILPQVDYIYTIEAGHIVEEGTYEQLSLNQGAFATLMRDYGGAKIATEDEEGADEEKAIETAHAKEVHEGQDIENARKANAKSEAKAAQGSGRIEGRLMQQEKRTTGSIGWPVYNAYIQAGRGWLTVPMILLSSVLMQGAQVMSALWLTYWEDDEFQQPLGFYMGVYAMVGILQAVFTFGMGSAIALLTYFASAGMHHSAIERIFYAPMSFFHTTPLGRILGVFGKDIDVLDSQLSDSLRMATMILGNVLSGVVIVSVFFPYFLIAVFVLLFGYAYFWTYYRSSSRELKRLDSLMRGLLYAHFNESLTGLPTIRAYEKQDDFKKNNTKLIDLENRAYFLTAVNQRWLSIRIDSIGAIMALVTGIMAAVGINGVSPAQIGLILTFTVSLTQSFGMVTRQSAEVENNMNAAERIQHYSSDQLAQESLHDIPDKQPPPSWPHDGEITFRDVVMAYRPGLPPVLKNISAVIRGGEKIGIVGRTGAGKSSIMQALFRIVELRAGSIVVDGINIAGIGLDDLRSRMAIIPQEPQLFSGTIRSNLDPFDEYDDAKLHDAMRRAYLLEDTASEVYETDKTTSIRRFVEHDRAKRFRLDTIIDDGGENLSVGERSLVSLARALVKDSKIIVLDECTASVDLETDAKIQNTIRTEFAEKTLLCIAHRLRTIIGYDRIVVLEAGEIVEFDTPAALFEMGGLFYSMCTQSAISMSDVTAAATIRGR